MQQMHTIAVRILDQCVWHSNICYVQCSMKQCKYMNAIAMMLVILDAMVMNGYEVAKSIDRWDRIDIANYHVYYSIRKVNERLFDGCNANAIITLMK